MHKEKKTPGLQIFFFSMIFYYNALNRYALLVGWRLGELIYTAYTDRSGLPSVLIEKAEMWYSYMLRYEFPWLYLWINEPCRDTELSIEMIWPGYQTKFHPELSWKVMWCYVAVSLPRQASSPYTLFSIKNIYFLCSPKSLEIWKWNWT